MATRRDVAERPFFESAANESFLQLSSIKFKVNAFAVNIDRQLLQLDRRDRPQ